MGGPNQRKDFHLELGEELFYMKQGDMKLIILEKGKFKTVTIQEGEVSFIVKINLVTWHGTIELMRKSNIFAGIFITWPNSAFSSTIQGYCWTCY